MQTYSSPICEVMALWHIYVNTPSTSQKNHNTANIFEYIFIFNYGHFDLHWKQFNSSNGILCVTS